MSDELGYSGLTTLSNSELLEDIQEQLTAMYSPNGEEIDFSSDSPDGQFANLLATIGTTHRELLTNIYNATDPEKCDGTQQDTKYQLNYLTRKGGTYTTQEIDITVNKTVTLQGLDGSYNDSTAASYAVSDDSGNIWYLIDTTTLYTGTTACTFRAQNIGAVTPTIGTITTQVTIVDGVVSVINNVSYTSLGTEQESNAEFRLRRARSTGNQGGNTDDAIIGNILDLDGVTDCYGYTNGTSETDDYGTLAHYAWYIVDGGANVDIAEVIYANIAGAGTRGEVTVPIDNIAGVTVNINFDRPEIVPLYIKFNIQVVTAEENLSTSGIIEYIAENLTYTIGEAAETSKVTTVCADAMENDGGDGYALNVQISTGGEATASISGSGITSASVDSTTFQDVLGDSTAAYEFTYTSSGWTYNDSVIELSDYGITYEGTPETGDTITIDFTSGTWTDYIQASSPADKFTTDTNKIYITVLEN